MQSYRTLTSSDKALRLMAGLVIFSIFGSLLSAKLHLAAGPIAPISSLAVLLSGCAAVFLVDSMRWNGIFLAAVFGAACEICGIFTGWPFGHYHYTEVWWPTVSIVSHPFPLLLPFAWLMVAGASYSVASPFSPLLRIVGGGLVAAIVDLLMEPAMTSSLHYWAWEQRGPLPGGAPVLNFFGWWLVASSCMLLFDRFKVSVTTLGWKVLGLHLLLTFSIAFVFTAR